MTPTRRPRMVIVGNRTSVRGAIREFIEVTTPYKACDVADNDVSAIHKAMALRCDLVLLHLTAPLQQPGEVVAPALQVSPCQDRRLEHCVGRLRKLGVSRNWVGCRPHRAGRTV